MPEYRYNPIKTTKTSFMGTMNMLGLAKRTKVTSAWGSAALYGGFVPSATAASPSGKISTACQNPHCSTVSDDAAKLLLVSDVASPSRRGFC